MEVAIAISVFVVWELLSLWFVYLTFGSGTVPHLNWLGRIIAFPATLTFALAESLGVDPDRVFDFLRKRRG